MLCHSVFTEHGAVMQVNLLRWIGVAAVAVVAIMGWLLFREKSVRTNPRDGQTYVWIPPGKFSMGCSPGDHECGDDEKPAREVTTIGFWMGQTEVTQAAYQKVMGSNPSKFKGENLPVENVTWTEAVRYCDAVGLRLPTEGEWEYAARSGTTGARYGELDAIAWHEGNSGGRTHEVKGKQANAFGLYDILGNVSEWTGDWYEFHLSTEIKALRGGSWDRDPRNARASNRGGIVGVVRSSEFGFRCVGEIP